MLTTWNREGTNMELLHGFRSSATVSGGLATNRLQRIWFGLQHILLWDAGWSGSPTLTLSHADFYRAADVTTACY